MLIKRGRRPIKPIHHIVFIELFIFCCRIDEPKILFLNRQDAKNAKKNIRLENLIRSPCRLIPNLSQQEDSLGVLGVLGGSTEFFRMNDPLTPQQRSYCMSQVKGKNTKLELRLRKAAWNAGLRYRLATEKMAGKPDFIFPSEKVAVFVDGCFWHGCPQHLQQPQANYGFWDAKLKKNVARDETVNRQLKDAGWLVLRFWEHELDYSIEGCVARIRTALELRKAAWGE